MSRRAYDSHGLTIEGAKFGRDDQWMDRAACKDLSTHEMDLFTGTQAQQAVAAHRWCRVCPVQTECGLTGLKMGPDATKRATWGGMSTDERLGRPTRRTRAAVPPKREPRPVAFASPYIGVNVWKRANGSRRWRAQIRVNGRLLALGVFPYTSEGELEAAKAYDRAAYIHRGEDARLNFPREQ